MIQFLSGFAENINYSDLNMNHLNHMQVDAKSQKQSNTKTSHFSTSGSNSNANGNGIYVDLGKSLLEAAKSGDTEKVQECIKNGAPFITDWLGTSALHVSAKNNYYETCATLLRSGISKDSKTKVDRTPLHFAVFEGNFEICQLLIQHECSIDPLDMLKMTPLHWAVEKSFDNIAELLIENGANPHTMSKFLKTPYLIAKEKNNDFIVNLIEMLPSTPCTPLSLSNYDSSVFIKTSTSSITATNTSVTTTRIKEEPHEMPSIHKPTYKRERFHSYDSADTKRLKPSITNDAKNLTLQLLKEQMSMMSSAEDNLIQSALQSGRKIMLSEAGRRLLNDSSLNKFLKIPLNTTISSTPSTSMSVTRKSVSPRSATKTSSSSSSSTTARRISDSSADVLEIFREASGNNNLKQAANADILNIIRTTSELQEVTITQRRSSSKSSPISSPIQKTAGVSLSAIKLNVPKAKAQNLIKSKSELPSSSDVISTNSSDFRSKCHNTININNNNNNNVNNTTNSNHHHLTTANDDDDFSKPETVGRKYSELFNNYQQLKKSFEREKQKSDVLQRQLTQLQSNFESYKRQQQLKLDSILQVLLQQNNSNNIGERRSTKYNKNNNTNENDEDADEIL